MEQINAHLIQNLPEQDESVISGFETNLKTIQAEVRLLHNEMVKLHPSDASQHDVENDEFRKWFNWIEKGQDKGFWTELVSLMDASVRKIEEDKRILESENRLKTIFDEESKTITKSIPSPESLRQYLVAHRGDNPTTYGMRYLGNFFSSLINRLSIEIQEFGPVMQDRMIQVLDRSGLGPAISGSNSSEKLRNLIANFEAINASSPIVEVLKETVDLPRNLKYVLRYELRPAVDFCDPTLWDENETAWDRIVKMIRASNGDKERLATFESNKNPPFTDSREKDHEILKKIAGNTILGIYSVLNNERYLPRRIADDFMRDARARLCLSPESEQEWHTLLYRNRGILLQKTIGKIRAKSEQIKAFRNALNDLEMFLP
jgi:hypothetical protein